MQVTEKTVAAAQKGKITRMNTEPNAQHMSQYMNPQTISHNQYSPIKPGVIITPADPPRVL